VLQKYRAVIIDHYTDHFYHSSQRTACYYLNLPWVGVHGS